MSLSNSTIRKANDRHRFVTPELSLPYLNGRERANRAREARMINAAIQKTISVPSYGTDQRLWRARMVQRLANTLLALEQEMARYPTAREFKTR